MKKLTSTALFLAGISSVIVATEAQAAPVQTDNNEQTQFTNETIFQSPFYLSQFNNYTATARNSSIMSVTAQATPSFTSVNALVDYVITNLHNLNPTFSATFVGDATTLILLPLIRAKTDADDYLNGIGASASYTVSYTSKEATFTFEASYFITKEQQAYVDQEVKRIVAEIIRPGMSDLEKVLKN